MTKTHNLLIRKVDRGIFEAIKDGSKTVETRAATEKYRQIEIGDVLDFVCREEHLQKKVAGVKLFKTVEEMVKELGIKSIMPFVDSLEEMKEVYYSFPGYEGKIKKFGLIAFEFK